MERHAQWSYLLTLVQGDRRVIGDGDGQTIRFWEDDWLGIGPVRKLFHGPLNKDEEVMCLF